jgi:hypothetical protein
MQDSIPDRDAVLFAVMFRSATGSAQPLVLYNGFSELFPNGRSSWIMELTTHLHLAPRSRIYGALTSLFLFVFMLQCLGTRTTLPFIVKSDLQHIHHNPCIYHMFLT